MDNTLLDNATQLQAFLNFPDWLNFISVGASDDKPCIYLYTNRKNIPRKDIPDTWYDMPVIVQRIGKIRPAIEHSILFKENFCIFLRK